MNPFYVVVCTLMLALISTYGGVRDHVVYDERDRYQLDALDGIVSVQVKKYFAFSDIGLIKTLVEERKHADLRPFNQGGRVESLGGNNWMETIIYSSVPGENEKVQLLRNTIWLFEVKVTKVYSGDFKTNSIIYVASMPTRACTYEELPQSYLADPFADTIDFGLVQVSETEFDHSFFGLSCYLNNDLQLLDWN